MQVHVIADGKHTYCGLPVAGKTYVNLASAVKLVRDENDISVLCRECVDSICEGESDD